MKAKDALEQLCADSNPLISGLASKLRDLVAMYSEQIEELERTNTHLLIRQVTLFSAIKHLAKDPEQLKAVLDEHFKV